MSRLRKAIITAAVLALLAGPAAYAQQPATPASARPLTALPANSGTVTNFSPVQKAASIVTLVLRVPTKTVRFASNDLPFGGRLTASLRCRFPPSPNLLTLFFWQAFQPLLFRQLNRLNGGADSFEALVE